MLTFRPIREPEAKFITRARAAIYAVPHHPDAEEIGQVIDVLSEAIGKLTQIGARIQHAEAREAVECERHGMLGMLSDAAGALAYAVECWAEEPENDPAYLRAANRADFMIRAGKEG